MGDDTMKNIIIPRLSDICELTSPIDFLAKTTKDVWMFHSIWCKINRWRDYRMLHLSFYNAEGKQKEYRRIKLINDNTLCCNSVDEKRINYLLSKNFFERMYKNLHAINVIKVKINELDISTKTLIKILKHNKKKKNICKSQKKIHL